MTQPKVSVLISVYNQLHCLDKALNSALAQTYPNLEIVIGDDHSSDGDVGQYIKKWQDNRIAYFYNEKNLGVNGNFYRMLSQYATGDYAILLNADDYWTDTHFIAEAMQYFQKEENIVLVFGDVKVHVELRDIYVQDKVNQQLPAIMDGNWFFINYPSGFSLPHMACLYNRKRALELDFYKSTVMSEDWEAFLKLVQGAKLGYIKKYVGVLTKHTANYTKSTSQFILERADTYIHNLYKFALSQKHFPKEELDQWYFLMLKRHHVKWLIKLWFLDKEKLTFYEKFIQSNYPDVYKGIRKDYRYQGYLIIRRFPGLLKWVFRNVLKQESFILDLMAYNDEL